jgi:DNA-binding winged helix-turn-helix (wHTH) protein
MYYQFAAFSFDPQRGLEGPAGRIGLRRCDADLLCMLLEADGRIVTKEAILNHVWRGRLVTEHSISQAVRRLRAAFGPEGESVIQTVYGSGFRLGVAALRQDAVADTPRPAFAPSPSLEATTSLATGWELVARRSPRELAAAIQAAQLALERDPRYVAAWCGLGTFHVARAARMVVPPREAGAAAVQAAERALQLDATCAPALALRGWVRACIELDVAAGLEDLARSLDITGNYWLSRGLYGWVLMAAGRPAAAAAELRTACELNPWGNWFSGILAQYLHFAGDNEAAISAARESVLRFPDVENSHMPLSLVASGLALHEEAIAAGRRAAAIAPDTPIVHGALARALARAGRRRDAEQLIHQLEAEPLPAAGIWLAGAHVALGNPRRAIDCIAEAREIGAPQFAYAFVDPGLAALRGVPAFERLRPRGKWSG